MLSVINSFLAGYGVCGFGIACFLAGTFFPFSSEAVMAALLATGQLSPLNLVISGTIGNVAGSMVNYYIGSCVDPELFCKWFKIKKSKMEKAQIYVQKYGAYMGFFAFLPILGTAISLALGMMKTPVRKVFIFTLIGKFLRYVVVAYSVVAIF